MTPRSEKEVKQFHFGCQDWGSPEKVDSKLSRQRLWGPE